jgi:hypothetical protein
LAPKNADSHQTSTARHAALVLDIKKELREKGERGHIHKKAMAEAEKRVRARDNHYERGFGLPPDRFNEDAVTNYLRRSKKSRSTKGKPAPVR